MFFGAGDEARTRYLHLGKVALYRMSYTRRKRNECIIAQNPDLSTTNLKNLKKTGTAQELTPAPPASPADIDEKQMDAARLDQFLSEGDVLAGKAKNIDRVVFLVWIPD